MLPEVVEPVLPPDGDPPPAHAVTARVAQNPATTVDARRRLRRLAGDLMCLPFCPSRGTPGGRRWAVGTACGSRPGRLARSAVTVPWGADAVRPPAYAAGDTCFPPGTPDLPA